MYKRMRFEDQLIYAKKHGINVDVDGESYNHREPKDVISVMQNGCYMVDYDSDLQGKITGIHVRNVSHSI